MKRFLIISFVLLSSLLYLLPDQVYAAETLQQQIDAAAAGSTIEITEDYTEDLVINKDITLSGNGTNVLTGAMQITGGVEVVIEDLQLTANTTDYLLQIMAENNVVTLRNVNITSAGNGVLIDAAAYNTQLTMDNVAIVAQKAADGRALAVRGSGSVVNIENGSVLTTTGGSGAATLHINTQDPANTAEINITDSEVISDNYYAFFSWGGNITANITRAKLSGYAAIYLKPDSTNTIQIDSSQIIGITKYSGPSDGFAAIVIEGSNNQITAANGTVVTNEFQGTGSSNEQLILFSSYGTGANNQIALDDVVMQNTNNENVSEFVGYNTNDNEITITENTEFIGAAGEPVAVTRQTDGQFVNAYSSFDNALEAAETEGLVLQLAPGTYTRENGSELVVTNPLYLALSEEVKEAAQENFPSVALADISGGEVIIKANSISLAGGDIALKVGETVQLEVVFDPVDTTDKTVVYEVADENIASVDATGMLTAKAKGTTTLKISTGEVSATYNIEVLQNQINWRLILIIVLIGILVVVMIWNIIHWIFWWL